MQLITTFHVVPLLRMNRTMPPRSICLHDLYRDNFTLNLYTAYIAESPSTSGDKTSEKSVFIVTSFYTFCKTTHNDAE
jgi:hypothetical protein